jgi:hypothetical protein
VAEPAGANLLLSLSMALRQASADLPTDLPQGTRLAYTHGQGIGGALVVTVAAKDHSGTVVWVQGYDHRGHRIEVPRHALP